jgi:hypothetical protein
LMDWYSALRSSTGIILHLHSLIHSAAEGHLEGSALPTYGRNWFEIR